MVNAVHALLYAKDAGKARAFLRDVLGWPHVDAGDGWLIFAMPPGEIGVHPTEADGRAQAASSSTSCART